MARRTKGLGFALLLLLFGSSLAWSEARTRQATPALLESSVGLSNSRYELIAQEDTLFCFEGQLSVLINPGCFVTQNPPQPGDCTSTSGHFFVQYFFPDVAVPQVLEGFGFLSNDGDTVFPSAGVLQLDVDNQGFVRFPTATELANLPITNIDTPGDTSVVFVDLRPEDIVIQPGDNKALVICLQFPEGGQLTAETVGPAIAAEADPPDQDCDFFTVDGGASGTWFAPFYDPGDPQSDPLEWGFVVQTTVAAEKISWTQVKKLYHTP
ncbi:MAG: hypothetical protein JSW67_11460 [Candidatus Latescibacterota bacterium]|nr:MAG: hypothetical protein JSW67_11460 [Candidatus Latescibacterota bacterium]